MVVAVIPSRFHSRRFPGKALTLVSGEPLVTRVARRVAGAGVAQRVIVATDDARIAEAAARAWVEVWLHPGPCRTGTDRVAAAIRALGIAPEVVLNVQGDEALVDRPILERAVQALDGNDVGTVAVALGAAERDLLHSTDTVKVEVDSAGRAVDFSRRPLGGPALAHVGVYSFTNESVHAFAALPSSRREQAEHLEQLRALEAGLCIGVRLVEARCASVNRPQDLARVEALLEEPGGGAPNRTEA